MSQNRILQSATLNFSEEKKEKWLSTAAEIQLSKQKMLIM